MGINLSYLPFFDKCHQVETIKSPFCALGSQEIHDEESKIINFCKSENYPPILPKRRVESLLSLRYGITEYVDLDINESATIKCDLSRPIPSSLRNRWMTVFDGGTVEHVFNIGVAFKNIHEMCCVNGTIIHVSPISWPDHGYFNLTPRLFLSLSRKNNYRVLATAYYFNNPVFLSEINLHFFGVMRRLLDKKLIFVQVGDQKTPAYSRLQKVRRTKYYPANTLFLIAYQKTCNSPFIFPYDIQE